MQRAQVIRILALTLWGIILSVGVVLYVRYDPYRLARMVTTYLVENWGVECRVNRLDYGFFPRIHVRLEEVSLDLPHDSHLDMRAATIYMRWGSLLRGKIIPSRVDLDTPALNWRVPKGVNSPLSQAAQQRSFDPATLPRAMRGLRVSVNNGYALYDNAAQDHLLSARGVHGLLRLPGLFSGSANLRLDELLVTPRPAAETDATTAPEFAARLVRVWAGGIEITDESPRLQVDTLELAADLERPGFGRGMLQAELTGATADQGISGRVRLDGDFEDHSPIPLSIELPFSLQSASVIRLDGARLRLDQDEVVFNGQLALGPYSLPENLLPATAENTHDTPHAGSPTNPSVASAPAAAPKQEPVLTGKLDIKHLSLPRWFDFARMLPGGIERALDNLTGTLELHMTPRSLKVPQLNATLCGMEFLGSGGVPDFSKPEIRLDAHTKSADVNAVLPELLQRGQGPIDWPHPAPVTSDPGSEGPNYNIHLTADKATAWKFDLGRFAFRCTPVAGGTRLNIDAGSFYGGTLASVTDITNAVNLNIQLDNVAADKPVTLVTGRPILTGTAQARAVLTAPKDSFDHFLASLGGTIQAQVSSGHLGRRVDTAQAPFESLQIQAKMAGAGLLEDKKLPPRLTYSGNWNAQLRTKNWESNLKLDGALLFDSQSFAFAGIPDAPGRLQWSGMGMSLDMRARFGLDSDKDIFTLRQGEGRIDGGSLSTHLTASDFSGHSTWKGAVTLTSTALGKILEHNGLLPADMPAGAFQHLQLSTDITYSDTLLYLDKLKGRVDDTSFSGFIRRNDTAQQIWQADLDLGTLNLSRYLPKGGTQADQASTPWPRDLLATSAKGTLTIQSLAVAKLVQRAVRIPFMLEKQRLVCAPLAFTPYGGRGEGNFEMTAEPGGYRTRLRYAVAEADAARFSHEAGLKTVLGGKTKVFVDLAGLLGKSTDIPAALSGNWSIDVSSGYMAELDSTTKPIPFNTISASGVMREGVLNTQNITLQSPSMTARGKGDINLVDWTLDCRLNVSTAAFTNVPVSYTGSLDAPERSINALNAVAGAIGKLGTGLFGLVGDILSAPFKLIK